MADRASRQERRQRDKIAKKVAFKLSKTAEAAKMRRGSKRTHEEILKRRASKILKG